MAGSLKIDAITPLATIPRPLDPENGLIYTCSVKSLAKSRKRKISEICACIDGTAVNIYNVEKSRLSLSHAVPPQTRFISAPCSLLFRNNIRRTYIITSDRSTSKSALSCFEEKGNISEGYAQKNLSIPFTNDSPVVLIDVLNATSLQKSNKSSEIIIILRQDGQLESLTADLSEQQWSEYLFDKSDTLEVIHAISTTAPKVKRAFLSNREDLMAQLEALSGGNENLLKKINMLCVVCRTKGNTELYLSLFAILPRINTPSSMSSNFHKLVSWKLPNHPEGVSTRLDLQCHINLDMRLIHITTSDTVATYVFTSSAPQILSKLSDQRSSILSQFPLPRSTLLTASRAGYTIYDLEYNSILDQRSLNSSSLPADRKRKRDGAVENSDQVKIIDFLPELAVAIILRGRDLLSIQIRNSSGSKKSTSSCSLADVLGKGINSSSNRRYDTHAKVLIDSLGAQFLESATHPSNHSWQIKMNKLSEFAENGQVDEFEKIFASQLNYAVDENNWKFPNFRETTASNKSNEVHRQKAVFALRLIFKVEKRFYIKNGLNGTGGTDGANGTNGAKGVHGAHAPIHNHGDSKTFLSINFFPPNVFHWLVISGQLTKDNIEHAFRLYSDDDDELFSSVSQTSLVDAIVNFDPSLQLLFSVVTHHLRLESFDLAQCIKHIINSLDESDLPTQLPAIINGGTDTNDQEEVKVDDEADEAVEDVDFVITTLEHGISMRGDALRQSLVLLNAFPTISIVDAFRECLTKTELIRLINILRVELEDSGWIARYIDPDPTAIELGVPSNNAISIISKLLGCIVDAIGLNGWLDMSMELNELLISIRGETSIALEGIHEATFMVDMLDQFLTYSTRKNLEFKPNYRGNQFGIKLVENPEPRLPIGLGLHSELSSSRLTDGMVEKRRSRRDIGQQISMKVPKYSFETIRIQ